MRSTVDRDDVILDKRSKSTSFKPADEIVKFQVHPTDPTKTASIGAQLNPDVEAALREFLRENWDIFAWHLCVDFKDLNKACPKDPFPLPRIDQIIDATAGHDSLCFLDAYSGYHQIKMVESDQAATAFITPYGPFCFNIMPFGLKNAGATYQRMIQTCLANQIGKTVEAYIDDVVVKTKHVDSLVTT